MSTATPKCRILAMASCFFKKFRFFFNFFSIFLTQRTVLVPSELDPALSPHYERAYRALLDTVYYMHKFYCLKITRDYPNQLWFSVLPGKAKIYVNHIQSCIKTRNRPAARRGTAPRRAVRRVRRAASRRFEIRRSRF